MPFITAFVLTDLVLAAFRSLYATSEQFILHFIPDLFFLAQGVVAHA